MALDTFLKDSTSGIAAGVDANHNLLSNLPTNPALAGFAQYGSANDQVTDEVDYAVKNLKYYN